MLVGPASCGKTFLLKPLLDLIPNVFQNPPGSTFGWMGAEKANLIFLNDLRWKPPGGTTGSNIHWHTFLNLLEGLDVSLPAAMNVQSQHVHIKKPVPILATSIAPVTYHINHPQEFNTPNHAHENEMMEERWSVFSFSDRIPKEKQKKVPSCGACFRNFILHAENDGE